MWLGKFTMLIVRAFSANSIDLAVINEYGKGAVIQISTVLGHIYNVACGSFLWNRNFYTFIWLPFGSL